MYNPEQDYLYMLEIGVSSFVVIKKAKKISSFREGRELSI